MPALDIKTVGGNGSFNDVIAAAPPEIQKIAQAARPLLADVMPGITEVPWARQQLPGYGAGPRKIPIRKICSKAKARTCGISRFEAPPTWSKRACAS